VLRSLPGLFGRGAHVETHHFEGLRLLTKSLVNFGIGLEDHGSEIAFVENLLGVCPSGRGYGTVAAAHNRFKLLFGDLFRQEFSKLNLQISVNELNVSETETELELDMAVVFDQILNSEKDSLEAILNYVFAHIATLSNRNSVGVNHSGTLLEDGVLRVGGFHFLFSIVTDKMCLETLIDDKASSVT
jgi:hypothetical protein